MKSCLHAIAVFIFVLCLVSCAGKAPSSEESSKKPDSSETLTSKAPVSEQPLPIASDIPETLSNVSSESEQLLPISITLTLSGTTGPHSKTIFDNVTEIETIIQLLSDCQPLSDTDDDIEKRNGGTIITALLQINLETNQTLTCIRALPKSLGYEVMVIRGDSHKYYTDLQVYEDLLVLIKNYSQTENYK